MTDPTREAGASPASEEYESSEYSDQNNNISIPMADVDKEQQTIDPAQLIDTKVGLSSSISDVNYNQIEVVVTLPSSEQELLQEFPLKCWEADGSMLFSSIVAGLFTCHYDIHNCRLLYYSHEHKLDVYAGYVGQSPDSLIPYSALLNNRLILKIKPHNILEKPKSEEEEKDDVYIPGMHGSLPPPPILQGTSSIKAR